MYKVRMIHLRFMYTWRVLYTTDIPDQTYQQSRKLSFEKICRKNLDRIKWCLITKYLRGQ